ncbi:hypothetical protein GWK47_035925 [Chionoecetes opilio]|uniref:Uncharacterized protein n=1 Tax=Chionoecetes opilio TaxID=41210 RepID=A0A8J4YMV6_CHIOP|nr:hypothetical protein GWK47_035925 [Chionoecetes opilio]
MTNQEDKEFLLAQREPGRRKEGRRFRPCCQETRQSFLKKAAAFPRPQQEGRRFLICGAARVLPVVHSNTSAVVSVKIEQLGASLQKRAKRATKNIVPHPLGATLIEPSDRLFRDIVLTEAERCLARTSKSST